MDTVSIATFLVQGQMASAQGELAATLLNNQNDMNNQVVSLLGSAAQGAASVPPSGTGEFINVIA
jgi:hypothetical protein